MNRGTFYSQTIFRGTLPQKKSKSIYIYVEQSNEWRSPLYLVFIDFKRAFDSLSHRSIISTLVSRGVPRKITNLIASLYQNSQCRVFHQGNIGDPILVNTGVKQGCLLSPLLFILDLDSVMLKATREERGIRWGLHGRLEDLDYADDICLMTHSHNDMQAKLDQIATEAAAVGLEINVSKTKALRIGTINASPFHVFDQTIQDVEQFCYLGSIISKDGGSISDVKARIGKASAAFSSLRNVWKSSHYTNASKIKLFNTNVKSILLYGCETWKVTKELTNKLQVFINGCLRKIFRIFWPEVITNTELLRVAKQVDIGLDIRKRKWNWVGHILRRPDTNIPKMALDWNPQGSRPRGRPKLTWKRSILSEAKTIGKTWSEMKALAQNRVRWRHTIEALCSTGE